MDYQSQLFCLLSLLSLCGEVSAFTGCEKSILTVKYVPSCPTDEVSWKEKAREMNCDSVTQNCAMSLGLNTQNNRFQYHCLMNSHMNGMVEVCALNRTIFGFCAEFDKSGAVVQENYAADCKKHNPPCPGYYDSAEAYKYKSCYALAQRKTQTQNYAAKHAALVVTPSSSNSLFGNKLMLTLSLLAFKTIFVCYM